MLSDLKSDLNLELNELKCLETSTEKKIFQCDDCYCEGAMSLFDDASGEDDCDSNEEESCNYLSLLLSSSSLSSSTKKDDDDDELVEEGDDEKIQIVKKRTRVQEKC